MRHREFRFPVDSTASSFSQKSDRRPGPTFGPHGSFFPARVLFVQVEHSAATFSEVFIAALGRDKPLTVMEDHSEVNVNWIWIGDRKPTHEIVRINHYHTRSMEDWIERYQRGQCNDPDRNHTSEHQYSSRIFKSRDHEDVHDTCILRFAGRLKAML